MASWRIVLVAVLVAALLASPAAPRAGPDPVTQANDLRIGGCGARPAVDSPLAPERRLDAAAARVAAGEGLQEAASAEGYRAARVARIRVTNARENAGGADLARLLEEQFCAILADPELVDVGLHETRQETWLLLAAPLALAAAQSPETAADRLFAGINDARKRGRRCGSRDMPAAAALRRSPALDAAARRHAADIAARGVLGHDGADGSTASERVARAGYRWQTVGENVAAGQRSAEDTVDTWIDSPGHCGNLMNPRFTETGVAVALNDADDRVIYWVQVYAAPQ